MPGERAVSFRERIVQPTRQHLLNSGEIDKLVLALVQPAEVDEIVMISSRGGRRCATLADLFASSRRARPMSTNRR